jgi:hypothetical protein
LAHSSYLDLSSADSNAKPPTGHVFGGEVTFNVALVLDRANAPTDLLAADWGTRQKALAELEAKDELWSTYGADPEAYQKVLDALDDLGIPALDDGHAPVNGQYVSSPESRTIWVQIDQDGFKTLFGESAALRETTEGDLFWEGNLGLPKAIADAGVKGLWFDTGAFDRSTVADPGKGKGVTLDEGAQSPGNSGDTSAPFPNEIAALYNFPFADKALWNSVETPAVALLEPGVGTSLPEGVTATFDELLQVYREAAGITAPLKPTVTVAPGGQAYASEASERSLDVGVVSAINPNSRLVVYAGSGTANNAGSDPFTAYQAAIWDTVNGPAVISSSVRSYTEIAGGSPFRFALDELFVDAALRNVTVVNSAGDGGSGDEYGNGLTNVTAMHSSPFALAVGGTSVSTVETAETDKTLDRIVAKANDGHRATVWKLVKGGLTDAPGKGTPKSLFIETVWNAYVVYEGGGKGSKGIIGSQGAVEGGYLDNLASAGGVDITQPIPDYQRDFGLTPTTTDPRAATGRGVPDVSAASGGNMKYKVPTPDFGSTGDDAMHPDAGTSAAAPLWAALVAQIDTIFADQKLPRLGYMNELLYTAAVIAPASFNDVTIGDNTSSFLLGGKYEIYSEEGGEPTFVKPTGYGYSAADGYDLVSGLGTPNGMLLARAMATIAHAQLWHDAPDGEKEMLAPKEGGGWKSTAKQGFLVQIDAGEKVAVKVQTGDGKTLFGSGAADKFAWTSQFAQQALQEDFDRKLVKMFDGQSQGTLGWVDAEAGERVKVKIDGHGTGTPQGTLSTAFGFVDYVADEGAAVRIARPVAVQQIGGLEDETAVIRYRQASRDEMVLKLYRVDDLEGRIDGIKPGEKGYKAAVNDRAYETSSGKAAIKGPGYGKYGETEIKGVDSGDIVAMKLKQGKHTYWAFAEANETAHGAPVGHLWNYGLNTFGWESGHRGGDRDYNDFLVQIDFVSSLGNDLMI